MASRKPGGSARAALLRGVASTLLLLAGVLAGVLPGLLGAAPAAGAESGDVVVPRPPGRLARQVAILPEPVEIPDYAFSERKPSGEVVERAIVEFRGQIVLLNFWATWCGVCRKEMPKLDALAGRLADQGSPIEVLALSIDDEIEEAGRALAKRGHDHLRVFHDHQVVLAPLLGVRGVPTTFVVDPRGRAVAMTQGPADWDSEEALTWLQALAATAETAPGEPEPTEPPILQSATARLEPATP